MRLVGFLLTLIATLVSVSAQQDPVCGTFGVFHGDISRYDSTRVLGISNRGEGPAQPYTVAAWVRRESTKVDDAVFVVGDSSSSDSPLRFGFNVDDQFTTGTDAPAVDGIFAINDVEQWRHIAVTFDGSFRTIYKNGVQVAKDTTPVPGFSGDDSIIYSAFTGGLDELFVFSYAITKEHVQILATATSREVYGDLVNTAALYVPFENVDTAYSSSFTASNTFEGAFIGSAIDDESAKAGEISICTYARYLDESPVPTIQGFQATLLYVESSGFEFQDEIPAATEAQTSSSSINLVMLIPIIVGAAIAVLIVVGVVYAYHTGRIGGAKNKVTMAHMAASTNSPVFTTNPITIRAEGVVAPIPSFELKGAPSAAPGDSDVQDMTSVATNA